MSRIRNHLICHPHTCDVSRCCWCLQAGQGRSLGRGSTGPLVGRLCHRLRLHVRVLEQGPAGAFPPGDRQRLAPDVREVLRPRLGVSVPAQPPAHQLRGPADWQSGLHDTRLVVTLGTSVVLTTAEYIFCMKILMLLTFPPQYLTSVLQKLLCMLLVFLPPIR